jgi:hypothetical protein
MSQLTGRAQVRLTLQQFMVKAGTAWLSSLLRPILGFRLTRAAIASREDRQHVATARNAGAADPVR